ncbi:LutC/YkgG family protein [Corynebacterium heidelbergense]|uniref:LUD domain-containing protein n=1 Tax=Corynebacterium heidelbergense TaxID=2055947 RepID=A0A364V8T7_9CORY|nr:LUD domain-containing protein [Corynebacterium heidelbergense]RAV33028.1 hypothetical protein DLJ54_00720 [Corynebacterium heidelbergense]
MSSAASSAKADILGRIRAAYDHAGTRAQGDNTAPPETIPRDYRHRSSAERTEILDALTDRLEDYDATVTSSSRDELPKTIARLLQNAQSIVTPAELPEQWFAETSARRLVDSVADPLGTEDIDAVDAVVTSSGVTIADTGTIVLVGPESGRRIITLLPDHHVVVVPVSSVVHLVPEAISRLVEQGQADQPMTLVSGPSATVDIELIRVHGVHGPRNLDVILLED